MERRVRRCRRLGRGPDVWVVRILWSQSRPNPRLWLVIISSYLIETLWLFRHQNLPQQQRLNTMIIPVRCFTCGKVVGNKWETYLSLLEAEVSEGYEDKQLSPPACFLVSDFRCSQSQSTGMQWTSWGSRDIAAGACYSRMLISSRSF